MAFFTAQKNIILASNSPRRKNFLRELGIDFFSPLEFISLHQDEKNQTIPRKTRQENNHIGVLAKDDVEARPSELELPRQYVKRMAIQKMCELFDSFKVNNKPATAQDILMEQGRLIESLWQEETIALEQYVLQLDYLENCPKDLGKSIAISADTIVAFNDKILGKPLDKNHALRMLSSLAGQWHEVLTSVCVMDFAQNSLYCFTDKAKVHFAPWENEVLQKYIETNDPMDKAGSYGIQGIGIFLSDHIEGSWDTVAGLPVAKLLKLLFYCKALKI